MRRLIADFLDRLEKDRTGRSMREYADAMADRSADFVRETDAHTLTRLLEETEW